MKKKRAHWRALKDGSADFDPDAFDWQRYGEHFDELSDDEWAAVWKHVLAASVRNPSAEARVRELVDDAAYSSGWFAGFRRLHISSADYRQYAKETRRFLKKVRQFRQEMVDFFGEPSFDHKEPFDPWDSFRPVVPVLDRLGAVLEREITQDEDIAASIKSDPPNAAKPELDLWRARLLVAWQNECGLPVENTKHLRGFLLDALRPYMSRAELTDRMAKHFISRWLARELENPGTSLLQRLKGDK